MKILKIISFLCLFTTGVKSQRLIEVQRTKTDYAYGVYLPENYDSTLPYPTLVFLHGVGEKGSLIPLHSALLTHGPIAEIYRGLKLSKFIIIEPQYYNGMWNANSIKSVVVAVGKTYPLDSNRFYVTGLSMGGGGTINFTDSFFSSIAADFAASPAGGFRTTKAPQYLASKDRGFGVYICTNDAVVGTGNAFNSVYAIWQNNGWKKVNAQTLKPSGIATAFLDRRTKLLKWVPGQVYPDSTVYQQFLVSYDNGGHGGWQRIFADYKFYDWLLTQKRN